MKKIISQEDLKKLQQAKNILENPGIAAKLTDVLGAPIESGFKKLPENWSEKINEITKMALLKASDAAIFTMKDNPGEKSSNKLHKLSVAVTGGVSGFFGLPALAIELPISTTIMLRSIAEIARSQGESISDSDTKLACLMVFALGGRTKNDDGTESGYYIIRTLLARSVSKSSAFLTKGVINESAPALLKFIGNIASRFGIQVTEKMAAQAMPLVGAAGGAIINTLFIDHFQEMAKGHFIVRKLEKTYGKKTIETAYEKIKIT
jgi:hypothetical protein